MRINGTLYYTLKDHLGSASVVTNNSGIVVGEQRYYPYGETRLTTGSMFTDKLFTGQREMAGLGIYDFNARFYSPKLGRFISADTIVPGAGNPQAFNRYSYVLNSPLRYTDPTGHRNCEEDGYNCPGTDRLSIILGRILFVAKKEAKNWKVPSYIRAPSNSENLNCSPSWVCVPAAIQRGIWHEDRIVLTGDIIDDIKNDPQILKRQRIIVDTVKRNPKYGIEEFTRKRSYPNSLTLGDDDGNMLVDAKHPVTWVARAVNVGVDIHVLQTGEIYLNYEFTDVLDLKPDWNNPDRLWYNRAVAYFFGPIYHGLLGGSDQMEVHAQWMTIIK